jgi:hypothetical protein
MMLRQWSRRSVSTSLGRRLQQRPVIQSCSGIVGGGGRRAAAVSTVANSSWIHHRSLSYEADDAKSSRLATISSRAFSSAAEEYHPEPRPFKKLMAGKHTKIMYPLAMFPLYYLINFTFVTHHKYYIIVSLFLSSFSQPR